mgnify:FL=1
MRPIDTISEIKELQMFSTMIQITGLDRTLHGADPFTIFAPRDRAFTQLPKAVMQQLTSNASLLTEMVNSYIVSGDLRYEDLLKMCKQGEQSIILKSLDGALLPIDLSDGIKIGSSTVITADIHAENGTIYSIDRVTIPNIPQQTGWMNEFSSR